jgi:hypothetical protein
MDSFLTSVLRLGRTSQLVLVASLATVPPLYAGQSVLSACAPWDLHLFSQVEDAGVQGLVKPEVLLDIVERMMAARRACSSGSSAKAMHMYEELDLGLSQVRWLQ